MDQEVYVLHSSANASVRIVWGAHFSLSQVRKNARMMKGHQAPQGPWSSNKPCPNTEYRTPWERKSFPELQSKKDRSASDIHSDIAQQIHFFPAITQRLDCLIIRSKYPRQRISLSTWPYRINQHRIHPVPITLSFLSRFSLYSSSFYYYQDWSLLGIHWHKSTVDSLFPDSVLE